MGYLERIENFIFRKIHGYPLRPYGVLIETTNNCNFHCGICARDQLKRPFGLMEFSLFKKVINDVVDAGVSSVRLQFFGEPLLHPKLAEMINYAKSKNIRHVNFNTNVSLLNRTKAEEILSTELDQIQFSLDAASSSVFDMVRSKGFFDTVVSNIESFFELKKNNKKNRLHTVLKVTATKYNLAELPAIIRKWIDVFDEIQISPMVVYEDVDMSFYDKEKSLRDICIEPFQKLVIFWNGDVSVCCYDINGYLKVGNILQESILNIWRGRTINQIRNKIKAKQYGQLTCCKNCELPNKQFMVHSANLVRNILFSNNNLRDNLDLKLDSGILYLYKNN